MARQRGRRGPRGPHLRRGHLGRRGHRLTTASGASTGPTGHSGRIAGLVLAAGGGTRMGVPKALLPDPGDPLRTLVQRAVEVLRTSGLDPVLVVTGASAPQVRDLVEASGAVAVDAPDWSVGQSASLRAGLRALGDLDAVAACVLLVDLPDIGPDVVRRVLATAGADRGSLARAAYASVPGHPVLIGRDHWDGVAASASGDRGARTYLATHATVVVECGDLATGRDVDTPADLR